MKLIYWKAVKIRGFAGKYIVSNYSEVLNLRTGNLLSPYKDHTGAFRYHLSKNNNRKGIAAHKLVWRHFKKSHLGTKLIMHIDYNKENNYTKNLDKLKRGDYLRLWNEYKNRVRGVYKHTQIKKGVNYTFWRAVLKVNNKVKTLGYYKTRKEAIEGYFLGYLEIYKRPPFELR